MSLFFLGGGQKYRMISNIGWRKRCRVLNTGEAILLLSCKYINSLHLKFSFFNSTTHKVITRLGKRQYYWWIKYIVKTSNIIAAMILCHFHDNANLCLKMNVLVFLILFFVWKLLLLFSEEQVIITWNNLSLWSSQLCWSNYVQEFHNRGFIISIVSVYGYIMYGSITPKLSGTIGRLPLDDNELSSALC